MDYKTVKEVSDEIGYPEDTVRRWCRKGVIRAVRPMQAGSGAWLIYSDYKQDWARRHGLPEVENEPEVPEVNDYELD